MRGTRTPARILKAAIAAIAGTVLLSACGEPAPPAVDSTAAAEETTPAQRLKVLVEDYYDRYLELNPLVATENGDPRFNDRFPNTLSEQWIADQLALEQDALVRLRAVDPGQLDQADRLTYDEFRYGRELAAEGFRFPEELLPINQFSSMPVYFGQLGSGGSAQPFATVKDYDDFLSRMNAFGAWVDQAITNMRTGMQRQVVQPRVLIEKAVPQIASFLTENPAESLFFEPIKAFPDAVPATERARLTSAYTQAITGQLMPAYRRLHDFLVNDYLPATRTSIAATALPNGAAWYAYLVRAYTTTPMTPEEIHQIGLNDVKRIRAEMEQVKERVEFTGDLAAFFEFMRTDSQFKFATPEQSLEAYAAVKERAMAAIPQDFSTVPKNDFAIRPVETYREQSAAPASYMPGTPDGKRPGIFYVNTYDVASRPNYMVEAIFLHEAIPGHHFQISLQQEIPDLPRFRRFGGNNAYVEGWGLYAESLGRELGFYADPYQYFGALSAEIWRAVRLVVDTGMHAKGWTREQAMDYMRQNTALGEADIVAEIERYIAVPGQALSYKIGQMKFRELRNRANRNLKNRFDVREFHTQVLKDGALPLAVLDEKLARWEKERLAEAAP